MNGYAILLLALFGIAITVPLAVATFNPSEVEAILNVLQVILSPTVAVLGAIVGFHFGSSREPKTTISVIKYRKEI